VDNTIATPYLLNPFEFGADIVVYSATKGLNGHGNVIAGIVVENPFDWANGKFPQFTTPLYFLRGPDNVNRSILQVFPQIPFTGRIRAIHLNYLGAALSPFDAYLVLIGLETLSERISKQVRSAERIVRYLEGRPEVLWVKHPSAKGSPYAALGAKYLPRGAGGILSFGLAGTQEQRKQFLASFEVFGYQANIGDARSLVINPAQTTHTELDEGQQNRADIHLNTIRLSIGLEDVEDLIEDLDGALQSAFS